MIPPILVETLQWKHKYFSLEFWVGLRRDWLESYVLYLAWPEWKELKFYSPLWFHPFGRKHRGIAGGPQGEYHKITGNVWVEPWTGLQGRKCLPIGIDGKLKTPMYFPILYEWTAMALVRLRRYAGSLEHSLFAYVISTLFTCTGSFMISKYHVEAFRAKVISELN